MVRVGNRLLETLEVEVSLPAEGTRLGSFGAARSAFLPHLPYHLEAGPMRSNPLPIGVAGAPIVIEHEETGEAGQEVTLPCEVQGRFDRARDKDRFRFAARKDQDLWFGVVAERMGTSSDPSLRIERAVKDEGGVEQFREVGAADDLGNDPGERYFPLSCRDAEMALKIPEDGIYRITIMNQTGSGGADQVYRLILREPQPDFDLVAVPSEQFRLQNRVDVLTPVLRPGGSAELRVLALRREGFDGEIELAVDGLPPGVSCPPVKMGGGRTATLSLVATSDAPRWDGLIRIRGVSGGLTRVARLGAVPWPVNDWSKQFFETRLGPSVPLSVTDAEKAPVTVQLPESRAIEIAMGEKLELPVRLVRNLPNTGEFVLRGDGLPHKTGELKLAGGSDQGALLIASGKPGEFPLEPGTWTFRIRAEGASKYQPSQADAMHARARHRRLVDRKREHLEQLARLKEARDQALQRLDEVQRELGAGVDPDGSEKVREVRSQLAEAGEGLQAARETALSLQSEVVRAAADAKAAADLVKERDVRTVSYSDPITITVNPAPDPDGQNPDP